MSNDLWRYERRCAERNAEVSLDDCRSGGRGSSERGRKIRAIAFKSNGEVRILRDIVTTIPKGRTALLRTPLFWMNEGSGSGQRAELLSTPSARTAAPDGFSSLTSTCSSGQTFVEGACADAHIDGNALPDYRDADVFGACFDVPKCFTTVLADVQLDEGDCTVTIPSVPDLNAPKLSLAVRLPDGSDTGEVLGDGSSVIPLDKGTIWKVRDSKIELPRAICRRIHDQQATQIVASAACETKDSTRPSCGAAAARHDEGDGGRTTQGRERAEPCRFRGAVRISSIHAAAHGHRRRQPISLPGPRKIAPSVSPESTRAM